MPSSIALVFFRTARGKTRAAFTMPGLVALFRACEQAGIRRVIHFSAIGLEQPSPFSASKLAGDEALSMDAIVARYRAWLGWKPARRVAEPQWLATLLYRLGDFAAFAAVVGILGLNLTRPEIGW